MFSVTKSHLSKYPAVRELHAKTNEKKRRKDIQLTLPSGFLLSGKHYHTSFTVILIAWNGFRRSDLRIPMAIFFKRRETQKLAIII